jgi:hypothetical protein
VPKSELLPLIEELHRYGLGAWSIARLLGYSQDMMRQYQRLMGLPRHTYATTIDSIIERLPLELTARCLRVRTKSEIAHARAWNRAMAGDAHVSRHECMDAAQGKSVNSGGPVRPEKEAA